jgi:RNA polymerase-binding protein DksA
MQQRELNEYKKRLVDMRTRLTRQVQASEEALREDVVAPGDSSGVPSHPADSDSEGVDAEIAVSQNEEQLLEDVEQALERIEQATFGVCTTCGAQIAKDRLDALPCAATCIACARQNEREPERPKRGEPRRFRS